MVIGMFGAVKKRTLLLIVLVLLQFGLGAAYTTVSNTSATGAEVDAKQYWDNVLYSSSTHIFIGSVLSVESKWGELDGFETILSYASVSVSENVKGEAGSQITLKYLGGTVGNATLRVFYNPWGLIECHTGDRIKAFARQDEREPAMFQAIDVEVISRAEMGRGFAGWLR